MEEDIVDRLVVALQERDSSALFELLDPLIEIKDPLIGIVRRKYAKHYAAIPLSLFSDFRITVSQVIFHDHRVTANWQAIIRLKKSDGKKLESRGSIVIEMSQGRIYSMKLDFSCSEVLRSLFNVPLFGLSHFFRNRMRRKALDKIKAQLLSEGHYHRQPMTSPPFKLANL